MGDSSDSNKLRAVTIHLGDSEAKIETLPQRGMEPAVIRLSCWSEDHLQTRPLDISETELTILLQNAIRADILSPEFVNNLRSEIEI